MNEDQTPVRHKPAYQVRIAPPEEKFGAFSRLFNKLKANRVTYIAKIYAFGVVGAGICLIGSMVIRLKEDIQGNEKRHAEDEKYRFKHSRPEAGSAEEAKLPERIRLKIPDEFIEINGYTSIVISREKGTVETTTTNLPFNSRQTIILPIDQCEFNEDGSLTLDKYGHPINKGSFIKQELTKKFDSVSTYIKSLKLFK